MRWIIERSIELRSLVLASAAALLLLSFNGLRETHFDILPELGETKVEVQTEARGLSAAEVEAMLTVPLEADMLNGVPWLQEIRSESIPGLSSITMEFEPGTDLLEARQMVQERLLATHTLPGVSDPPMMRPPVSSTNRAMIIGVTSQTHSLIDLSVLARWTIVPRLMGVPGVANVAIWGQRRRQLQVQIDPARLRDARVDLSQIIETAGNALAASTLSFLDASTPGTGGWIETPNQRLGVQHVSPISEASDLAAVMVEDTPLRLGDVTTVVEAHQPLVGDALVDGKPGLLLVIERFPWSNLVDVTSNVEQALDALLQGLPGVEIDCSPYRPATYLTRAAAHRSSGLIAALLLGGIALVALLRSWRAIAQTLATLATTLAASAIACSSLGIPANIMSLTGVVIALVVVIGSTLTAAPRSSSTAPAFASLIILVGVTPLIQSSPTSLPELALTSIMTFVVTLICGFLVSITVSPALARTMRQASSETPTVVSSTFDHPSALPVSVSTLSIGILSLATLVTIGLLWTRAGNVPAELHTRTLRVEVDAPHGSSAATMRQIAARVSNQLRSLPEIRAVSAQIGRAVGADTVADIHHAELWIDLEAKADYRAARRRAEEVLAGSSGFATRLTPPMQPISTTALDREASFVVRIYGENFAHLASFAEKVRSSLSKVPEVLESRVLLPPTQPTIEIETDLVRAEQYGLKPGDIRRAAATLLSGVKVGDLFEDQKIYDVVVWGMPEIRQNLTDLENLLIESPLEGHVRLADVADVRIVSAPVSIRREGVARYVDVRASLAGDSTAGVANEIEAAIRQIELPLEYRAEVLGDHAHRPSFDRRDQLINVTALVVAFLLLQAALRSWTLAAAFTFALPAGLSGAVAVALALGPSGSIGALLGLLAIFGLTIHNGLSVVADNARKNQITTTAMVLAALLAPAALASDPTGLEILQPFARVVLGGLASATAFSLWVVPNLRLAFATDREPIDLLAAEESP